MEPAPAPKKAVHKQAASAFDLLEDSEEDVGQPAEGAASIEPESDNNSAIDNGAASDKDSNTDSDEDSEADMQVRHHLRYLEALYL